MVWSLGIAAVVPASAAVPADGTVIKSANGVDIYYVENGQKHRFLNPTVMKSWYFKSDAASTAGVDWTKVNMQVVSQADFDALPTGQDVTVRPGTFMIQFGLNTAIYAVGPSAELYKVDNPATAAKLFGANWGKKVVVFPSNYNNANRYGPVAGTLTASSKLPDGSLVKFTGDDNTYYVTGGQKQVVSAEGFIANGLNTVFVKTAANSGDYVTVSGQITVKADVLSKRAIAAQGQGPTTGTATVTLAGTSPAASTIIAGQAIAGLAQFNFTGSGTVTSLKLKRTGVSQDATLASVYLYDGNTKLTDAGTVSNGYVSFDNPSGLFAINGSKTITVKADITTGTDGQTIGISLNSASDIGGANVSGSFPVNGNIMSIAAATDLATADFGATVTGASSPIAIGSSNVTIFSNTVSVANKAVLFKYLKLKQVGSIDVDSLQNYKMYVDGVYVAMASLSIGNDLVFDLTSSPVTLNTGNRSIEIRADVVRGSAKNFNFYLQQASDVVLVDSNYGVAILPTKSGSTFSMNSGTVTISGIDNDGLTITNDPNFTATQVVTNSSNVTLGKWILKSYGENSKVMQLQAALALTYDNTAATTSGEYLNNVAIYVDGVQVGSSQNWSLGTFTSGTAATLTETKTYGSGNLFTVNAGETKTVEVRADLSFIDSTRVETVKANLVVPANQVQGLTSYQTWPSSAKTYLTANTLTVVTGNLTGAANSEYSSHTVSPNIMNQKIGSYVVQASNAEAVEVSNLAVAVGGSFSRNLLSELYVDYGSGKTNKVNAQANNNFGVNLTIQAGQSVTVDVFANVGNSTGTVTTTLAMTARTAGSRTSANLSATTGQTITIGSGTINVTALSSLVNSSIVSQYVIGGQTVDNLAVYQFKATDAPVIIEEMTFTVGGTATASSKTPITSLTVGGKTANVLSNTATVTGLSISVPTASAGLNVTVAGKLNIPGDNIDSGLLTTTTLTSIKWRSGSVVSTTAVTAASSNAISIVGTKPSLTVGALTGDSLTGLGYTRIGRVSLIADANGVLSLEELPLVLSTIGASTSYATSSNSVKVYVGSTLIATTNDEFASGTTTVAFTGNYTVSAGQTVNFDIYADVTGLGSTAGDSKISVKLGSAALLIWNDLTGDGSDLTGSYIFNYPINSATVSN